MALPRSRILLVATAPLALTGLAIAQTTQATTANTGGVDILAPDEPWAGLTRGEWDAQWWQWAVSMPEDINPNFDTTGERCGYGQSGPVFFLPSNFGGEAANDHVCRRRRQRHLHKRRRIRMLNRRTATVLRTHRGRTPGVRHRNARPGDRLPGDRSTANLLQPSTPIEPRHRCSRSTFPDNNIFGVEPGVGTIGVRPPTASSSPRPHQANTRSPSPPCTPANQEPYDHHRQSHRPSTASDRSATDNLTPVNQAPSQPPVNTTINQPNHVLSGAVQKRQPGH